MLAPDSYRLGKPLHNTPQSEVYGAIREADQIPVILKVYRKDQLPKGVSHARREFEILNQVQGPGLPRAIELLPGTAGPILVMERVPGSSLKTWAGAQLPSAEQLLEVAVQLTTALECVHGARVLHGDVHPGNVLVEPRSLKTYLIDLGYARPLGARIDGHSSRVSEAFGALPFIAPEQTGRMNRGIDFRSDLYSLGATLYYAASGQAPFAGRDPLELFHAHMARMPRPLVELRPELPATLSRIVQKLLQKEPEDRYQTAQAVRRDFAECRQQLQRTGHIDDDLPLGTADAPFRPLFTRKLYGREAEVAALHAGFQRAAAGRSQLVLLSGAPGIGKSALVHELRRALPARSGYLATGKYDMYRPDLPYSGLLAAFQSLLEQILTESEERLAAWRERLRAALGKIAGVLVELLPDLGAVVGEVPPVPGLRPQEAQQRLALAVQRFVQGCARPEHPLVLFLDDLQWSDPGSRDLLDALLRSQEDLALLVLGSYRDNEVTPAHPLHAWLARIEQERSTIEVARIVLNPISSDAVAEMLSDALGQSVEKTRALAATVVRKTDSNPLLIQQFVLYLHGLALIRHEHPAGWTWDDRAVATADIPEGAVALMVAKLKRMDTGACELLQFASCVADQFDAELLSELSGTPCETLQTRLFTLAEEGLIAPSPHGFRFVHDRIREAARALLSGAQCEALHHRMAQLLLAKLDEPKRIERAFELADHLNRAAALLADDERFAGLCANTRAGEKALGSGASATAATYFAHGRALFREPDWAQNLGWAYRLHGASADAAYQLGDLELCMRLVDQLEAQPLDIFARAECTAKRIRALVFTQPEAAMELTLRSLRQHGLRLPRNPSWLRVRLEILLGDWMLRGRLDERGMPIRPPLPPSPYRIPGTIMAAGGALLLRRSSRLLCLAILYELRLKCRKGTQWSPAYAISSYAGFRFGVTGSLRGMARYVEAAAGWLERQKSDPFNARAEFVLQAFSRTWLAPRRSVLEPLGSCAQNLRELGDVEFAGYAAQERATYIALCGEPLETAVRSIEQLARGLRKGESRTLDSYRRAYGFLQEGDPAAVDWASELTAVAELVARPHHRGIHVQLHWMLVLCCCGQYARASELAESVAGKALSASTPGGYLADFLMLRGLSAAATPDGEGARKDCVQILKRCARQLQRWAPQAPDVKHMARMLEAERLCAQGDKAALHVYQQAAQDAQAQKYPHHAALCHQRRAELLRGLRRKTESSAALAQAERLYREWGAAARARQLTRQA